MYLLLSKGGYFIFIRTMLWKTEVFPLFPTNLITKGFLTGESKRKQSLFLLVVRLGLHLIY